MRFPRKGTAGDPQSVVGLDESLTVPSKRRGFGRHWIHCAYLRTRKLQALRSRTWAILICSPTSSQRMSTPGMLRQRFSARMISKEQCMRTQQWMQIAALASAVGITGTTFATDTGRMRSNDAATSPLGQTPETSGVGSSERTEDQNFDGWMNRYATAHNGKITREEFMGQMGHRWDMMDPERRGYMSPEQARGIYMPNQKGQ